MILKEIDDKTKEIQILEKFINASTNDKQKFLIKQDLSKIKNGYESEKDNSYLINFYLKDAKNTVVLHDIRLEHNNLTAQIDHILINRVEIVVIESKSYAGILEIKDDGSFEVDYSGTKRTFLNPLEQNKRHTEVLKQFLDKNGLLKNQIGQEITIKNQVIINPTTTIKNNILPKDILRADKFISDWKNKLETASFFKITKSLLSMKSQETINEIANLLIKNHKPINFDYEKKYKIKVSHTEDKIDITKKEEKVFDIDSNEYDTCTFNISMPKSSIESQKRLSQGQIKKEENKSLLIENFFNKNKEIIEVKKQILEKITIPLKNKTDLTKELKSFRMKKSKEENFKPFMVFSDKTLEELIEKLPKTKLELKEITGFGNVKIEKYGDDILKIIN